VRTLSISVWRGSNEKFWKTTARSGPGTAHELAIKRDRAGGGSIEPAIRLSSVDLPHPEVTDDGHEFARLDRQVDTAQDMPAALRGVEHTVQPIDLEGHREPQLSTATMRLNFMNTASSVSRPRR
jgi:hypothetical protein